MAKYVALTNLRTPEGVHLAGSTVELADDVALSLAEHNAIALFAEDAANPVTDAPPEVLEAVAVEVPKPKRRKAKESHQ